jgi:hypothetical protein
MREFTPRLRRDYCRAFTSLVGIDRKVRCPAARPIALTFHPHLP